MGRRRRHLVFQPALRWDWNVDAGVAAAFSNNSTSGTGGGIYQAVPRPLGFSATGVDFAGNTASPSVNTNDPGGASGADDGGAIYLSAVPGGSGIPLATISGGSITGNSADGDGGGVYTTQGISFTGGTNIFRAIPRRVQAAASSTIADATTTVAGANIASNSATNTGGGITVGTELASNGNAFTIAKTAASSGTLRRTEPAGFRRANHRAPAPGQ